MHMINRESVKRKRNGMKWEVMRGRADEEKGKKGMGAKRKGETRGERREEGNDRQ